MRTISGWLAAWCLAAGPALVSAADPAACVGCHSPGAPNAPVLDGMPKDYLVSATKAYKSGERKNAIMQSLVAGLSDEDIEALAEHFAGLDPCQP
jgi:cytochrome c553